MAIPIDEQNIINILGIEALPNERKIEIVERISELVQKRLLVRVLDRLSAPKQEEFKKLLSEGKQAVLEGFLKAEAPDLADLAAEEINKVKTELKDFVAENIK